MGTEIQYVAVHDLVKADKGFDVAFGKVHSKITHTTERVIDTLQKLYAKRTSKSHGKFSIDTINFPTQQHVRSFIETGSKDFLRLTKEMTLTLRKEASQKGSATGGHVFYALFKRDNKQYLLVAIINDKLGAALSEGFDVEDSTHLDLEGFKFAGRLNVTAWLNGEERYLSFLKGKGNVADYFREFIGCDDATAEKIDTQTLITSLKKFADDQRYTRQEKDAFLAKAKDICARLSSHQQELSFSAFSNEMLPDNPDLLIEVLTDPEITLNDNFIPHKPSLNRLTKFQAKTKHWTLEFDRDVLQQGPIEFHAEQKILVIRDLPEDLVAELKSEIADASDV